MKAWTGVEPRRLARRAGRGEERWGAARFRAHARDKAGNVAMSEAVLEDLCLRAGLPAEAARRCVEAITAEETKRALAESVEEAVHRGGYGAPTIVVAGVAGREEILSASGGGLLWAIPIHCPARTACSASMPRPIRIVRTSGIETHTSLEFLNF